MFRPAGCAVVLAAALLFTGCPSCSRSAPPGEVLARGGDRSALGVKVPLPEGWNASADGEGALALGPGGHIVLRIDLRPGAGKPLPSPAVLKEGFKRHLKGMKVTDVDEEAKDDLSLVVLQLSKGAADAGPGALPSLVLLGAKRVGLDLYLCSTLPGASANEVKQAAGACRDIHPPQAP